MKVGVVIPVGPGRRENLDLVLKCVMHQSVMPVAICLVFDGPQASAERPQIAWDFEANPTRTPSLLTVSLPKHEPGHDQPRNVGVYKLHKFNTQIDHVWFLDSDVVVGPRTLEAFIETWKAAPVAVMGSGGKERELPRDRIIIGPYDWMPPGLRPVAGKWQEFLGPANQQLNDPRWPSFREYPPDYVSEGKLNDGLACFSGNLMWPMSHFLRVGGFWNDLHHGRCEDGELGLRAVAEGIPISFSREARGYHLHHEVNFELATQRNARDVPMLNARHPWVEGEGVFVVDKDGKRFDQRCGTCGELVNTIDYWNHREAHGVAA